MKKGIEILKEVYFVFSKEISEKYSYGMQYNENYEYMQVCIDWDNRKICTYLKSRWNSDYDKNDVVDF